MEKNSIKKKDYEIQQLNIQQLKRAIEVLKICGSCEYYHESSIKIERKCSMTGINIQRTEKCSKWQRVDNILRKNK